MARRHESGRHHRSYSKCDDPLQFHPGMEVDQKRKTQIRFQIPLEYQGAGIFETMQD